MTRAAELGPGATGEAVRDLQQRLAELAGSAIDDEPGHYGPATEGAVREFQRAHALGVDGRCSRATWSALVEAGYALGDRMLYHRQPMLRGNDVADLQRRLNALGFDAGREDGILGDDTAHALAEFQRNAGLAVDGILGPATLETLRRLGTMAAGSVAAVREREELRQPRRLAGRRVFVAVAPGLEALGDVVAHEITELGAEVLVEASGDDDALLAAAANHWHADLCLALRAATERPGCAHFASATFRSEAGYRIAAAILEETASLLGSGTTPEAHPYGLLRETRMAAVVCAPVVVGDAAGLGRLVTRAGDLGRAIAQGVRRGFEEPLAARD